MLCQDNSISICIYIYMSKRRNYVSTTFSEVTRVGPSCTVIRVLVTESIPRAIQQTRALLQVSKCNNRNLLTMYEQHVLQVKCEGQNSTEHDEKEGRICGSVRPKAMTFNCSTAVNLTFVSDFSVTSTGFILFFKVFLPAVTSTGKK